MYLFTRQRDGELAAAMGAYHGAELPYVFDTHDDWLPTAQEDRELTEKMLSYWSQFARTGDPNASGLPSWPLFEARKPLLMMLDVRPTTAVPRDLLLCELLAP